jgi:hypothetical protein
VLDQPPPPSKRTVLHSSDNRLTLLDNIAWQICEAAFSLLWAAIQGGNGFAPSLAAVASDKLVEILRLPSMQVSLLTLGQASAPF